MNRRFEPEDIPRALKLARCAELAAEAVHCVILAKKEATQIREAIDSRDWSRMWNTLQECLERYKYLVFAATPVTNITLVRLTPEQVARITTDDLVVQLRIVTGFVFAYHALRGIARASFKQCFEKLARKLENG